MHESRNREATSNATLVVYLNRPSLFRVSRACAAVGTRGNFPTPSFHCPRRDFSSREPMALSYRRARSTDAFFQTIQIDHRRPENIPRRESRIKSDRFLPVSLRNRRDMRSIVDVRGSIYVRVCVCITFPSWGKFNPWLNKKLEG